MLKRKPDQKGFTIIELLVVIVIIGILVALALPQLFAAQERGRDTERKNDLKNVKTQLETVFNDSGSYPVQATEADADTALAGVGSLTDDDLQGPNADEDYQYVSADGSTYTLTADLENDDDPDATTDGEYVVESVNQ